MKLTLHVSMFPTDKPAGSARGQAWPGKQKEGEENEHPEVCARIACPRMVFGSSVRHDRHQVVREGQGHRIGDKDETPEWTNGEVGMTAEGSDVVFVDVMTFAGNARPEACVSAAELNGRAQILRHVKDAITTSGQVNETSAASDPGYESLTAFISQGKIRGAKTAAKYWERREESDENGSRVLRVKCAVKVTVSKTELARQLREATEGHGGNAEIQKQLINAQKAFIDSVGKQGG
jgi:hypothetical protein